jgi:protein-L-isoaspartate(D-aspartate) O-methyltransferase
LVEDAADSAADRAAMVAEQLAARGISDRRVLDAMGTVPRELFTDDDPGRAYSDRALSIGCGQTISQPWVVAAICQGLKLRGDESVLEVGTGSGYSTAVLALLAREVISIERIGELTDRAGKALREAGIRGVELITGDGSVGLPERAPFDAIAVHAAMPAPPRALLTQLGPGGRLVAPVASGGEEELTVFVRGPDRGDPGDPAAYVRELIAPVRFVPLIGEEGYRSG